MTFAMGSVPSVGLSSTGFEAHIEALDLSGDTKVDKEERWDRASVHEFEGTYGDYVLGKVSKVFPELRRSTM